MDKDAVYRLISIALALSLLAGILSLTYVSYTNHKRPASGRMCPCDPCTCREECECGVKLKGKQGDGIKE